MPLSDVQAVHDCYLQSVFVRRKLQVPRSVTETANARHFPWLSGLGGRLEVEYQVTEELRLEPGASVRGLGDCDSVTHVSEAIDLGDWIRVRGGDTEFEEEYEPFAMPLRMSLRHAKIEPAGDLGPRRHAEPMVRIEGGLLEGAALGTFWIDRREVGIASYRECMEAGYCMSPECIEPGYCEHLPTLYDENPGVDYPVFFVTWRDAQVYCAWAGKRLPTLREWRWAAQGRDEARTFPWGEEPVDCDRANGQTSARSEGPCVEPEVEARGTRPAGASRDGVENLAGNVEEWVFEPWTSAGSSVADYFKESEFGEFTARAVRHEFRPSSGIRCAADQPPADALARSQPHVERVGDLGLLVHDHAGLRTRVDGQAYCDTFESHGARDWHLPSPETLTKLQRVLDLPPVPYWSADARASSEGLTPHGSDGEGPRRVLCVRRIADRTVPID